MDNKKKLRCLLMSSAFAVGLAFSSSADAQIATYYDNNVVVDLSVLEDNGLSAVNPSIANPFPKAKRPPVNNPKSQFFGLPSTAPAPIAATPPKLNLPQAEPQSRIVLKKPDSAPTLSATESLPKSRLATAQPRPIEPKKAEMAKPAPVSLPKPTPTPTVAATPKPPVVAPKPVVKAAPAPKAPMVKAEAPKPKPAPVKPVEMVKAEPVTPPKPVAKPTPTPTPVAKAPAAPAQPRAITPPAPKPAPASVMAEAPPPPPPSAVQPKEVASAMERAEKAAPKSTVTAALPPSDGASVRVAFQAGQSKLPASSQGNLKELAAQLTAQPDDRVQLLAFAGGENLSASKARRLSLSRALAVRSYLINEGVRSTRIDVRALGNKTTEEPFDRVDVQITPR